MRMIALLDQGALGLEAFEQTGNVRLRLFISEGIADLWAMSTADRLILLDTLMSAVNQLKYFLKDKGEYQG